MAYLPQRLRNVTTLLLCWQFGTMQKKRRTHSKVALMKTKQLTLIIAGLLLAAAACAMVVTALVALGLI